MELDDEILTILELAGTSEGKEEHGLRSQEKQQGEPELRIDRCRALRLGSSYGPTGVRFVDGSPN